MPKKCPECHSLKTKKNGVNQSGTQRLKCTKCLHCFVLRKRRNGEHYFRSKFWFNQYIIEGYSARQIANQSGRQEYLVRIEIQKRLDENRLLHIDEYFDNVGYVMIDGYHLPGGKILLVYYEYVIKKVLWFSMTSSENKDAIIHDLRILRDSFGYEITAFVIDGSPSILSAIKSVYPNSIIQRCLVHIQRQVINYISNHPKSEAGINLLHILNYPPLSNPMLFPELFAKWKEKYLPYLTERSISRKGGWIFTHTSLRKAMKHIENALPYMFQGYQYIDSNIERSTNKLEGYFGVFTNEGINEHKGLSEHRLYSFVALWIYFRNNK